MEAKDKAKRKDSPEVYVVLHRGDDGKYYWVDYAQEHRN